MKTAIFAIGRGARRIALGAAVAAFITANSFLTLYRRRGGADPALVFAVTATIVGVA